MTRLSEIIRTYHFPKGEKISIPNVRDLVVSKSGNHRLISRNKGQQKLHIVPPGWLHVEIESKKSWEM